MIFALLFGAELFGIFGALVALPVAAVVRETVVYLRQHTRSRAVGDDEPARVVAREPRRCAGCAAPREARRRLCRACGSELSRPQVPSAQVSAADGAPHDRPRTCAWRTRRRRSARPRPTTRDEQLAPAARQPRPHGPLGPDARRELLHRSPASASNSTLDQRAGRPGARYAFAVLDLDERRPHHRARRARQRRPRAVAERDARLLDRRARSAAAATPTAAVRLALRLRLRAGGPAPRPARDHPAQPPLGRGSPRRSASATRACALRYLKINGRWEDHDIYALTRRGRGAPHRAPASRPRPGGATCRAWPSRRRACAGCAARRSCATSCARRAGRRRPRPAALRRGRASTGARRSRRCPASTACRSRAAVEEAGEAAALGIPAVLLFGIPADKDEEGSRRLGRRGHRPARHARDQGRPTPSCSSSPTCACASTPTTATAACCATDGCRRQRRVASSCSRAPRSRRRAPAPTSSRRAT